MHRNKIEIKTYRPIRNGLLQMSLEFSSYAGYFQILCFLKERKTKVKQRKLLRNIYFVRK